MKNKEFLEKLSKCELDEKRIAKVEKAYATSFPVQVRAIISNCNTPIFLEEYRVLSFSEIIDAEDDLNVNFKKEKIIPLIDCGDNDFIVYNFSKKTWAKYNIIENCLFKVKSNLADLLK